MSELGTKLRDARIEKGYTLNTLQQMTKIQKKYLQAIEEGNYDEMPGSFYVRAFVKQYADMVGLDGDELLTEHGDELVSSASEEGAYPEETDGVIPSRVERHVAKEKNNVDVLLSYVPLILLVTIIGVIMVALIMAINSVGRNNQGEEAVETETTTVVSVVEPESVVIEPEEEVETTETEAEPVLGENDILVGDQILTLISEPGEITTFELNAPFSEYEFEVAGNAFVWVGAFEDGSIVLDTTIVEEETIEYSVSPGTNELRLTLGYPDGANFLVNGVEVEPEGQFLRETLVFVLGDDIQPETATETTPVDDNETIELELPETTEEEAAFQGPAVLDPANVNDGAE